MHAHRGSRTPAGRTGASVKLGLAGLLTLSSAGCGLFAARTAVAHDWILSAVEGNTLSLTVAVGSGNCDRFDRVDVEESPETVTLTAVVVETEAGTGPFPAGCNDDLNLEVVTVTLDQPLGSRELRGCAPGDEGLQNYYSEQRSDVGTGPDDCSAVVENP